MVLKREKIFSSVMKKTKQKTNELIAGLEALLKYHNNNNNNNNNISLLLNL